MKLFFTALFFILLNSSAFASDSLRISEKLTRENLMENVYLAESVLETDPKLGNKLSKDFYVTAHKSCDSLIITYAHYIMARAESYFGNYQLALYNSKLSLKIMEFERSEIEKFDVVNVHCSILTEMSEFDEALRVMQELILPMIKDSETINMRYNSAMGSIYALKKDYEKALPYYWYSLADALEKKNKIFIAFICNNVASAYVHLNKQDSADYYIDLAEKNLKESDQFIIVSYLNFTKAEYHYAFGDFEKGVNEIDKCIEIQKDINDMLTADAYELKSKLLDSLGRHHEAFHAMELYAATYKKYHTSESSIRERKNQLFFELNKTRTDIDILHKQLDFQRTTFYIISVLGIVVSIALTISLLRNRRRTTRIDEYTEIMKVQQLELKNINKEMEESREKIIFDANKLMHLNQKLIDSEEELKQLNVTKDKFFSIIAHDLKNPFASMKNLSDLLHDNYSMLDEEDRVEIIASMKLTSQRIFELLENLLTWSRSQRGIINFNPDIVTPLFIVQNNFDLLAENAANKDIALINEIPDNMEIVADSNLLSTIIRNLTSNAIKFTPAGGNITVGATDAGDYTEFYVKDTGVGISEADIQKLFRIDISHTTIGTGAEKGTGLGLILCKEFVEKHDGRIWVESEISKGTTFKFTLKKMSLENFES